MMQRPSQDYRVATSNQTTNLAELLERVLDKGIVIAGDITVSLAEVELLSIKVRLLVASIDKAREIGINWWESDPALSTRARHLEDENRQLRERVERLEARIAPSPSQVSSTSTYGRHASLSQPHATPTWPPRQ